MKAFLRKLRAGFSGYKGEIYIDSLIKTILCILIGSILLTGVYNITGSGMDFTERIIDSLFVRDPGSGPVGGSGGGGSGENSGGENSGGGGELLTPTQLTAPINVRIIGTVLSWDAVTDATSYQVYKDGVPYGEASASISCDLSSISVAGTYAMTVCAIADDNTSPVSTSCSYTVIAYSDLPQLAAPTNLRIVSNSLFWDYESGLEETYELSVDEHSFRKGILTKETGISGVSAGSHDFSVRAGNVPNTYAASEYTTATLIAGTYSYSGIKTLDSRVETFNGGTLAQDALNEVAQVEKTRNNYLYGVQVKSIEWAGSDSYLKEHDNTKLGVNGEYALIATAQLFYNNRNGTQSSSGTITAHIRIIVTGNSDTPPEDEKHQVTITDSGFWELSYSIDGGEWVWYGFGGCEPFTVEVASYISVCFSNSGPGSCTGGVAVGGGSGDTYVYNVTGDGAIWGSSCD